jgi:hypothetical protein
MTDVIKLAAGLNLPRNGVTQTWGFIARKGAGKTYAAGKLVEEFVRLGAPVIIIDPVGTWYGLRLAADGKSPGLAIPVFGGEHGDVQLDATRGEDVARLLVSRDLSAVVDVSGFRKNERKRFVAEFAEKLFHEAKRNRVARVVVFEEAQVFAPQRTSAGEERMLGAVEDIVRLGRNYGLGSVLISQRPQSVNKEVLNQVEALFVGQISGPQERKAIDQWVIEREGDRKWLSELPELPVGTMMLWSPQWLRILKKVRILKKTTFDASATPELGAKLRRAQTLAEVDVEGLRSALEAMRAKPALAVAAARPTPAVKDPGAERELAALRDEVSRLRTADAQRVQMQRALAGIEGSLQHALQAISAIVHDTASATGSVRPLAPAARIARQPSSATKPPADGSLRAGIMRMLESLATFYPGAMTKPQIARAAKMKVTGGTFSTYWSTLKQQALIEESGSGLYRASEAGLERLGSQRPDVPQDMRGRVEFWNTRLRAGEQRILEVVLGARNGISRADLAASVEMAEGGGTFSTYLSTLTTNRLIAKQDGALVPHTWLLTGGES